MLETVSIKELKQQQDFALLTGLFPDVKTHRGLVNVAYRIRALGILTRQSDCEKYAWLADKAKMTGGGSQDAWQPTILMELGKIADPAVLLALAEQLCRLRPSATTGARLVRQAIHGKAPGNALDLANELIGALNDYLVRYNCDKDMLAGALDTFYCAVRKSIDG